MLTFFPQFSDRIDCRFFTKHDDRNIPQPRVRLHQVHGNRTIVTREAMESSEEADGVVTDAPELPLMVRAADCQNFAVYAPEKHVGGTVHVGWRGVVSGALQEFFKVLETEFGIGAHETYVVAGPSMCLECSEYKDPEFELRQRIDPRYVHGDHVDLQGAATMQLLDIGVPRDHFSRHPDCTRCNPETYLTYRGGDKTAVQSGESNVLMLRLL